MPVLPADADARRIFAEHLLDHSCPARLRGSFGLDDDPVSDLNAHLRLALPRFPGCRAVGEVSARSRVVHSEAGGRPGLRSRRAPKARRSGPRPGGARAPPPSRSGVGRRRDGSPRSKKTLEAAAVHRGADLYRQPGTAHERTRAGLRSAVLMIVGRPHRSDHACTDDDDFHVLSRLAAGRRNRYMRSRPNCFATGRCPT